MGVAALELLEIAAEDGNGLELRTRATALVKRIRAANRLPTRVNGVEFRLVVDKEWSIPAKDKRSIFKGTLELKNTSKKDCRFYLSKPLEFLLIDAQANTNRFVRGYRSRHKKHDSSSETWCLLRVALYWLDAMGGGD